MDDILDKEERNRRIIKRQQTVVLPEWLKEAVNIYSKQQGMNKSEVFRAGLHALSREDDVFMAIIIAARDSHIEQSEEPVFTPDQQEILNKLREREEKAFNTK